MNRASITRTEFINYNTGTKSYGYRVYDDYEQSYSNCFTREQLETDPLIFLGNLIDCCEDEVFNRIIEHCIEFGNGLYIDDEWYDYESLKGVIER